MKKLFACLAIAVTATAQASTTLPVYNATLTGASGNLVIGVQERVKKQGIDVKPTLEASCGRVLSLLRDSKDPIAASVSSNWHSVGKRNSQDCEFDRLSNLKALVTIDMPYGLCVKKGTTLPTDRVATLGIQRLQPVNTIVAELNNNTKKVTFKGVRFKSSRDTVYAIVSGDIDAGYINYDNALTALDAGSIDCLYSTHTGKGPHASMREFTGRADSMLNAHSVSYMLVSKNLDPAQEKTVLDSITDLPKSLAANGIINVVVGPNDQQRQEFVSKSRANQNLD